jgi:hypothetical protein
MTVPVSISRAYMQCLCTDQNTTPHIKRQENQRETQAVHGLDNDSQLDDVRTRFTAWHATGFSLCFAKVAPVAKYG